MFILYCNNNPILWLFLYSFYLCITVRMHSMQRFTVCCSVKIVQCMTICISLWNMLFAKNCVSLCECELCRCLLLWCHSFAMHDKLYWFIETLSCMRICVWKVTLQHPLLLCAPHRARGCPSAPMARGLILRILDMHAFSCEDSLPRQLESAFFGWEIIVTNQWLHSMVHN